MIQLNAALKSRDEETVRFFRGGGGVLIKQFRSNEFLFFNLEYCNAEVLFYPTEESTMAQGSS